MLFQCLCGLEPVCHFTQADDEPKMFKVPVASLICHGHHVNAPFWNTSHERGIAYDEAEFSLLLKPEDIETMTEDEINERLVDAFQYDDFAWQKGNKIRITDPKRAEGLDKVLYQCPNCKVEYKMYSNRTKLICGNCSKVWELDEYGSLVAENGSNEFSHIPD